MMVHSDFATDKVDQTGLTTAWQSRDNLDAPQSSLTAEQRDPMFQKFRQQKLKVMHSEALHANWDPVVFSVARELIVKKMELALIL